ncbi:MAG: sugar-binding transcriptional regulator [Synergistaceae bacterium]|nr:sugar-binding transcriptional regulator [Synergistaceae bacterium]
MKAQEISFGQLRLISRIAGLYYREGLSQPVIASQLSLSQASVSRLLKMGEELGIIRISVEMPEGVFSEIESAIEKKYGVKEVVVTDNGSDEPNSLFKALGGAAASWLENHIGDHEVVGVSSWSETLFAAVEAMRGPITAGRTSYVVQLLGGLGVSSTISFATQLTESMARIAGAQGVFLMVPGICESEEARNVLLDDAACRGVFELYERTTMLLVGIGSLVPSRLLRESRNETNRADQEELRSLGAVGDICLRYFDNEGRMVDSGFDRRVIGISPEQVRRINNTVVVGGGLKKLEAIRAALKGGWINTLITDSAVASELVA